MNETLRAKIARVQLLGLVVGIVGLALCVVGAIVHVNEFFVSYMFGLQFWLGLSVGCLVVAMIHYLTGGRWGDETRRVFEAGYMTLPLMALLFVPILFSHGHLFPWARPAGVGMSKVLQHKAHYQNFSMFTARAVFVFTVWIVMAWLLRRWSLAQDETKDVEPLRRMRTLSGPGIVIYGLTTTLAFVDWVMSLEADWYSTMFPVIVWIGQVLTALTFGILALNWFRRYEPMSGLKLTEQFHQLGNLVLAFVIFWTYVSFGQFLIIWSGNLPHEIGWYLHRVAGGWKAVIAILGLFHFFVPFFLLLFRVMKKNPTNLAVLAGMVFLAHIADVFWMVEPSVYRNGIHIGWMDFAAWFGIGGVWLAVFIVFLKRAPLLPHNDPRVQLEAAHAT